MKIAVLPGSTKTAQAAVRSLLADPSSPNVIAFYRDPARAPAEFTSNTRFEAVRGDLMDAATLDLTGCDAVLAITPPTFEDVDIIERARKMSQNTRDAVRRAAKTVNRLVLLSSQGAQFDHGVGEIGTNHVAEVTLKDAAPEVVFVRCAYFMENWMMALQTLRSENPFFYSTLTPLNHVLPMVSIKDIGATLCAQLLSAGSRLPSNPHIFDLEGPDAYGSLDVQRAFEKALGKSVDVKPVEKEDLEAYWGKAFPTRVAKCFTEMTISTLPGGLLAESWEPGRTANVQRGETSLDEAISQLPTGVAPQFIAPSTLDKLTSYRHASSKSERFFCSTCGCHIGDRGLGGEHGTDWVIATSIFADHTEATFQIKRHCFTDATPGDGLHSFLPSIAGREIKLWNPDPEDPTWDAKPAAPPEAEYDTQGNERLRGQCHCGGVSFTVPRPTIPAVQDDPYLRKWASPLDPNKWIACLDVCDDCRLVDGTHVIAWTFLPAALLDPPLKPDLSGFGTLKVYNSSEGVRRGFCGTCGATVVFAYDGRIPTDQQAIVDIAIGVFRAPEGVLAENWLTWRSGQLAWPSSGERYDLEFTKALKEGLAAWGMRKHGVAADFKID